jgi:hypothetical protein
MKNNDLVLYIDIMKTLSFRNIPHLFQQLISKKVKDLN